MLAYTFSKKKAGLCFLKNLKFKSVDVITCFSCTVKNWKFKSIQAHSWNPPPPPPFLMLSFSKCLVCVFCLFTPFLSVLFVFHRKNLVLLHLMNIYTISNKCTGIRCEKLNPQLSSKTQSFFKKGKRYLKLHKAFLNLQ